MKYNMNFYDVVLRYAIGYFIIMIGFLVQNISLMILGVPFILIGLLGICPLFYLLGIDHNNFESHEITEPLKSPPQKSSLKSEKNPILLYEN